MEREITYAEAIREATLQLMQNYEEVFVMGVGVDDFGGVWGTTKGLLDIFGEDRIIDLPLSENALTGIATGMALLGFRPIFVHQRMDFMLMCMDGLFNHAAKIYYSTGLQRKAPITIRSVIGKGWGQSIQHAQSFYPIFAHFPGIKIVAPFQPYDAKGLLIASVLDDDPVIIIEARSLYNDVGNVPDEFYSVELGKANVLKEGKDLTIVGLSYVLKDIFEAVKYLEEKDISVEVIDLQCIKPLDIETIEKSVKKTKNLVVVDITWEYFNIASEISSIITERSFSLLKKPPLRITLPDWYVGASEILEKEYYINSEKIINKILDWI